MKNIDSPLISVIMPIYNTAHWVRQTLDCVCLNSYKNLEIICVLDTPTDGSDKIVKDYAKKDPRVIVIEKIEKKGQGCARNTGFKHAKGEWIHFIDSDDLIGIDFYKNMLAATELADVDAVLCSEIFFEKISRSVKFDAPMVISSKFDLFPLAASLFFALWPWLFRKAFLNSFNFSYPEDMLTAGDAVAVGIAVDHMRRIATAKDAFYIYKFRRNSASDEHNAKKYGQDNIKGKKFAKDLFLARTKRELIFDGIYKTRSFLWGFITVAYNTNKSKTITLRFLFKKKKYARNKSNF